MLFPLHNIYTWNARIVQVNPNGVLYLCKKSLQRNSFQGTLIINILYAHSRYFPEKRVHLECDK